MARTRAVKRDGVDNSVQKDQQAKANQVETFLQQLADILCQSTKRSWKAKQVTAALSKSIQSLPDEELKTALQDNVEQHAAQLLRLLSPADEQQQQEEVAAEKKPAKRTKRTKEDVAAPAPTTAAAPPATIQHPAFFDDTLTTLVEHAITTNKLDKSIDVLAPLFARNPAPLGYIDWVVDKHIHTSHGDKLQAASFALQLCNAVATQSRSEIAALAAFLPAVRRLHDAVAELTSTSTTSTESPALEEVQNVASRAMFCMQTARVETNLATQRGSHEDSQWLSNWNTATPKGNGDIRETITAAEEACNGIVSIQTVLKALEIRSTCPQQKQFESAVQQYASTQLQTLAPYSVIGCLRNATTATAEGITSSPGGVSCFFAQFLAATHQNVTTVDHFMLYLVAARRVSALATSLNRHTLAAQLLETAAAISAPSTVVSWLQKQPPSAVVLSALSAVENSGPQGLSAHLIYDASEGAVKALSTAATAGEAVSIQVGGQEGAGGEGGTDDLLFFVSKEGDRTAFGGEWGGGSSDDNEDDEERVGLNMEELPDVGRDVGGDVDDSGSDADE